MDDYVFDYFKNKEEDSGIPFEDLINSFLRRHLSEDVDSPIMSKITIIEESEE